MNRQICTVLTTGLALLAVTISPLAALVPEVATNVRPLLVGAQAPSVQLTSAGGEIVDLATVLAGKPTVLVFYRGGW